MMNSVLCYLEDSVKKYPDKVAIDDGKVIISFKEWKHKALCIAEVIKKKVTDRQVPILVYLPKNSLALISFVGILYSGNYYTPTDVKFPFIKVCSVIQCLMPELIISDRKNAEKLILNGISVEKIILIEEIDFNCYRIDSQLLLEQATDTELAYVLFTSGSTGVPKGVSIMHRSIIDYIDWAGDIFKIDSKTRIANQSPFYFDNSVLDIYLCMSKTAILYIVPEIFYAFPAKLLQFIQEKTIDFIFWVPSVLINVANSKLLEKIDCSCLKKIFFAGEIMPNKHLNYWRKAIPDAMYVNLYGPTEITVDCTYYIVDREFTDEESLPIGVPCKNTDILILDEKDKLITDINQTGEICVKGTCLSVGYYNNISKTSEVFVQNPLNNHYGEKIYRTGDLAHYNEYKEIMFDGRKDFQIKHMGYRIELGEIETVVLSKKEIWNACCIYNTDKNEIVLFYNAKSEMSVTDIKKELTKLLPKYMIPSKVVYIENMPYNDNGKIDRYKLANMLNKE